MVTAHGSELTVELGDRSYSIVFDVLDKFGGALTRARGGQPGKCVVVSNTVVGPLYSTALLDSLRGAGWSARYIEIPDGEKEKHAQTYLNLVDELLEAEVDRKTVIIGLGGGVTTDIVGFAAATTLRGLPFCNVPTTLLAQVDAAVGGKTGVNTKKGKNLLGAFWQPCLVFVAVETLSTLSDTEFRCGMGEVVKHAVLEENLNKVSGEYVPSSELFEWLEQYSAEIQERMPWALNHVVKQCMKIKASVVSQDERESGKRAALNLGHTIGHAIEAVKGYGGMGHGEAVAIGLVAEAQFAVSKGFCSEEVLDRIVRLNLKFNLPCGIDGLNIDSLQKAVLFDKKRDDAHILFVMIRGIGNFCLEKIKPEELLPAFQNLSKNVHLTQEFGCKASHTFCGNELNTEKPAAGSYHPKGSNAFASGSNQNSGNYLVEDRPTTKVRQPPGGYSSLRFG